MELLMHDFVLGMAAHDERFSAIENRLEVLVHRVDLDTDSASVSARMEQFFSCFCLSHCFRPYGYHQKSIHVSRRCLLHLLVIVAI